jgi:hypothetical protein
MTTKPKTPKEAFFQYLSSKLATLREAASSGQSPDLPDIHRQIHSLEKLLVKLESSDGLDLLASLFGEEVPCQLRKGNA